MGKEDFVVMFKLLRNYSQNDKKRLITMLLLSVVVVMRPYVLVILLGRLIKYFTVANYQFTLFYMVIMIFLYQLLGVLEARLIENFYARMDYTKEDEERHMVTKAIKLKYSDIEDTQINELRFAPFFKSYFGVIGWCLINVEKLLEGFFSLIILIIIILPSLVLDSPYYQKIESVILLVGVLVSSIINYRLSVRYTAQAKTIADCYDSDYNKKRYYIDKLSDIEFHKDARLNGWKDLLMNDVISTFQHLKVGEARQGKMYIIKQVISAVISSMLLILVYTYVVILTLKGHIEVGEAVTLASGIILFSQNMNQFAVGMGNMKTVSMLASDYLNFITLKEAKNEGNSVLPVGEFQNSILEFCNVSFKYPGSDQYALKNINIEIQLGERLAFVGRNGSGKTTFIKLLCRLYTPTEGCIRLNGIDIMKYNIDEYWKKIAVVFQDFKVFGFGIGENIAATDEIDYEQVNEALRKVGLYQRVYQCKEGLNTNVGKVINSEGIEFSGGEKQKIAIARAIYKNAEVVIMDEPTAALDPLAEEEIYSDFNKLVGDKTAIYISHRLSSCKFCNEVFVFDKGEIVQRGKHEVLKNEKGIYKELWNAQAQYYV